MLNETDQYKFVGKYENATHLEEQVHTDVSEEYIKRLSVIWTSNIQIPKKDQSYKPLCTVPFTIPYVDSQLEDQ